MARLPTTSDKLNTSSVDVSYDRARTFVLLRPKVCLILRNRVTLLVTIETDVGSRDDYPQVPQSPTQRFPAARPSVSFSSANFNADRTTGSFCVSDNCLQFSSGLWFRFYFREMSSHH